MVTITLNRDQSNTVLDALNSAINACANVQRKRVRHGMHVAAYRLQQRIDQYIKTHDEIMDALIDAGYCDKDD